MVFPTAFAVTSEADWLKVDANPRYPVLEAAVALAQVVGEARPGGAEAALVEVGVEGADVVGGAVDVERRRGDGRGLLGRRGSPRPERSPRPEGRGRARDPRPGAPQRLRPEPQEPERDPRRVGVGVGAGSSAGGVGTARPPRPGARSPRPERAARARTPRQVRRGPAPAAAEAPAWRGEPDDQRDRCQGSEGQQAHASDGSGHAITVPGPRSAR